MRTQDDVGARIDVRMRSVLLTSRYSRLVLISPVNQDNDDVGLSPETVDFRENRGSLG
jgi:hypothetical protein